MSRAHEDTFPGGNVNVGGVEDPSRGTGGGINLTGTKPAMNQENILGQRSQFPTLIAIPNVVLFIDPDGHPTGSECD